MTGCPTIRHEETLSNGDRIRVVQLNENCFAVEIHSPVLFGLFHRWRHGKWLFGMMSDSPLYDESLEDALNWIAKVKEERKRKPS